MRSNIVADLENMINGLAIDRGNDVFRLQTGSGRSAFRLHFCDDWGFGRRNPYFAKSFAHPGFGLTNRRINLYRSYVSIPADRDWNLLSFAAHDPPGDAVVTHPGKTRHVMAVD